MASIESYQLVLAADAACEDKKAEYIRILAVDPAEGGRVHILDDIAEDISATGLRERLHNGDPCYDLLPEAVADYIQDNTLYR